MSAMTKLKLVWFGVILRQNCSMAVSNLEMFDLAVNWSCEQSWRLARLRPITTFRYGICHAPVSVVVFVAVRQQQFSTYTWQA